MDEQMSCLQRVIDHYSSLLHDSNGSLHEEYRLLREEGSKMTADTEEYKRAAGSVATNRAKNRYRDIIPFDATRVKLSKLAGTPYSDYINANFVQGIYGTNAYIASQAPLPNTLIDFWRMIWELNVRVVLMACNEYEANKLKCSRYWPNDDESDLQFGNVSVTLTSVDVRDNGELIVRRLRAESNNTVRTVMQYHYTAWPDHGIPQNMTPILDMLTSARVYQPEDEPPMVVHCSAGCGRTGTLLAIDYVRNLLKEGRITKDLSVLDILIAMRKQRQSLIQTPEQYETVFRAIKELFQQKVNTEENHLYENLSSADRKSKKLNTKKSIKESSAIAQNFLSSLSPDEGDTTDSLAPALHPKNVLNGRPSHKVSRRYKAEYENTEASGLFEPAEKPAEKSAEKSAMIPVKKPAEKPAVKPKLHSATITIGKDNEIENPVKAKPLPPARPKPAIPNKPSIRQWPPDSSASTTYSLAASIDVQHSSTSLPTDGLSSESVNTSTTSPPQSTRGQKKYLHRYSEVDDFNLGENAQSVNTQNSAAATYHLAGEVAITPESSKSIRIGGDVGDSLSSQAKTYCLAGEETSSTQPMAYHLAGEIDEPKANSDGNETSNQAEEEAYSYADLGDPKFCQRRQEMQRQKHFVAANNAPLVPNSNSSGQEEYYVSDDDDAPPPLPVKTDGAFDHSDSTSYSPVEYKPADVTKDKDNRFQSATLKKINPFNLFQDLKPKTKTLPTGHRGSNASTSSYKDDIMYRGVNMAYPNKMKGLAGARSMPMSFKR